MPGGNKKNQQSSSGSAGDPGNQCEKYRKSKKSKFDTWKVEADNLKVEVDKDSPDEDDLEAQLEVLRMAYGSLLSVHQRILDILEDTEDEPGYQLEESWGADVKRKMVKLEVKARKKLASLTHSGQDNPSRQKTADNGRRLPRLELPKFGGDVREWLPYWSQFEEIDKDKSISDSDKFQYLLQSMVDGSEAKEVVMSYPVTAKNYPLAVDQLKKRYGKDRMLVKVYVRDLIRLVIDNATQGKISLSTLYVKLSAQLRALGTLGVTTDKCAAVIYPLVESCLPEEVLRAWQRDPSYKEAQEKDGEEELKLLIAFLEREVGAEDNIKLACGGLTEETKGTRDKSKSKKSATPTANSLVSITDGKKGTVCLFCGKGHPSTECGQAEKSSLEEKKAKINGAEPKVCYNCLKSGHQSKKCKQFIKCLICGKKHVTVLCPELPHHRSNVCPEAAKKEDKQDGGSSTSTMANQERSPDVLMQTLVVEVKGSFRSIRTRLLVDSGSQKSYVTKEVAEKAGLCKLGQETVTHILFGGVQTKSTLHNRYRITLGKLGGGYSCDLEVSDVPVISGSIARVPSGPWIRELQKRNIKVSDYSHDLEDIGVLIGADVAAKLMTGEKLELDTGPVAVNTFLGWTLMGKLSRADSVMLSTPQITTMANLDREVAKLWDLEMIGITESTESKSRKELEDAALLHFNATLTRTEDGRYEVHLPWVEGHAPLPSNRSVAERRLKSATEKMKKENIFHAYDDELRKWESDGRIEQVNEKDWKGFGHYLPHRAVVKVGSTTPVRPVFDASCKIKGHPSINDCLEKGPNLLEKIPAVLTKIRMDKIGLVADIQKAFQQISIVEKDRDYLRFRWWTDETCSELKIYRHCRVVFGVTASPFLLAATLTHIAEQAPERLRNTAQWFVESTYVDNLAASVASMDEFNRRKSECDQLLLPARFNLRGWEYGPNEEKKVVPLLGLLWDLKEDCLYLDLAAFMRKMEGSLTKRKILSLVQMLFDPIGYTCPVSLVPKQMLQETWSLKIGWDSELPPEMCKRFVKWRDSIPQLDKLKVPRSFNESGVHKKDWELHLFTDASKNAYAAAVFIRIRGADGISVQLVQAKSRIKPIAKVTIPRMELLSCLIGSRLLQSAKVALNCPDIKVNCWTDSSTALHWIQNDGGWGVFVQRRVDEIRALTSGNTWRHIPGEMNPADLPSRGCTASKLMDSQWWEGPRWLYFHESEWPQSKVIYTEKEINEEKRKTVVSSLVTDEDKIYETISSLNSYEEMVAYVHRNYLNRGGDMSNAEFMDAERKLLGIVQNKYFTGENEAKLKKLPVARDKEGILKLQTRLCLGDFSEDFKYPILLPDDSRVTKELIRHEHRNNSHAGVSTLLSIMREKFWILKGRRTIRSAIRTCETCQRFSVKGLNPPTPALPKDRIQASVPYQITGVDYFGPLILRNGSKTWVALFTCAVYRAVHLELVPSLTTEDFILALRRFVSRRGRPDVIYSDNGTNFTGCNNALKAVNWKKVAKYGNFRRINWRFNPPTASWYGGWFERLVGVVKQTLRKVLGRSSLNAKELSTILCEAESVVNHRPLTYISDDGDELVPLTPQLFLTGGQPAYLPEAELIEESGLGKAFKYMKEIGEHLRSRFRKEYLGQLVNMKMKEEKRVLKIGDVVLIGHDNQKRLDWPLGKITEMFPGKDGKVRVVRVKTAVGELLRPVQRIFPLEAENSEVETEQESVGATSTEKESSEDQRVEGVTRSGRKVKIPERLTFVYI